MRVIASAVAMFAVTNVDDLVVLALLFGRARGDGPTRRRIVTGQYLGFAAITVVALLVAAGAKLLDDAAVRYLGVVPLALGLHAALELWRNRGEHAADDDDQPPAVLRSTWTVMALTFANGGDNIGVYAPVFALADPPATTAYAAIFLALVGPLCWVGSALAGRPRTARLLDRWGDHLFPLVLIAIGVAVLVQGS